VSETSGYVSADSLGHSILPLENGYVPRRTRRSRRGGNYERSNGIEYTWVHDELECTYTVRAIIQSAFVRGLDRPSRYLIHRSESTRGTSVGAQNAIRRRLITRIEAIVETTYERFKDELGNISHYDPRLYTVEDSIWGHSSIELIGATPPETEVDFGDTPESQGFEDTEGPSGRTNYTTFDLGAAENTVREASRTDRENVIMSTETDINYSMQTELYQQFIGMGVQLTDEQALESTRDLFQAPSPKINEMTKFTEAQKAEIAEIWGEERVDFQNDNKWLVIHYPELVIKNVRDKCQHTIRDMFVKFQLDTIGSELFQGTRTTLTYAEDKVGYLHSHCKTKPGVWHRFCQGSTMTELIDKYKNDRTWDNFLLVLYTLDTFLTDESPEGGPFYWMRTIYQTTQTRTSCVSESDLHLIPNNCINYKLTDGVFVVDSLDTLAAGKSLPESYHIKFFSPSLNLAVEESYTEDSYNYAITADHNYLVDRNKSIEFKGERLFAKAIPTPPLGDLEEGTGLISGDVASSIKNIMNGRLRSAQISMSQTKANEL
jgi:hypothetical protein